MATATDAGAEISTLTRRRAAASLARAPHIPRRKNAIESPVTKRAAVVLRRGMRPLEFRQVEQQMDALNLVSLPVLPGQRKMHITETPVCGLVVTGSDIDPSPVEREMIEQAVRHVRGNGGPVLAFSDAVGLVLEAAGLPPLKSKAAAVLIHDGAHALTTPAQIENAMKLISKSPEA